MRPEPLSHEPGLKVELLPTKMVPPVLHSVVPLLAPEPNTRRPLVVERMYPLLVKLLATVKVREPATVREPAAALVVKALMFVKVEVGPSRMIFAALLVTLEAKLMVPGPTIR